MPKTFGAAAENSWYSYSRSFQSPQTRYFLFIFSPIIYHLLNMSWTNMVCFIGICRTVWSLSLSPIFHDLAVLMDKTGRLPKSFANRKINLPSPDHAAPFLEASIKLLDTTITVRLSFPDPMTSNIDLNQYLLRKINIAFPYHFILNVWFLVVDVIRNGCAADDTLWRYMADLWRSHADPGSSCSSTIS